MQIKILKDFKWSHNGRLIRYVQGENVTVTYKEGEAMVKHGYAEMIAESLVKEQKQVKMIAESLVKMQDHNVIEDKMMHFEVENKADKPTNRRSRKQKEVENE